MTQEIVLTILEDYKAHDIKIYPMTGSTLADLFIIASGDASKHIDAMADGLRLKFKGIVDSGGRQSIEGTGLSGWVLIDLGDIVVHLFTDERRSYYALDDLWSAT